MKNRFALTSYLYDLPEDLIAQYPCHPRDASRLLVVERDTEKIYEMPFKELCHYLEKGDSLVFNDTKVIPSRLIGQRLSGGKAEVFLLKKISSHQWEALVKPGKKMGIGTRVYFGDGFFCEVIDIHANGQRLVQLEYTGSIEEAIEKFGHVPLPYYMRRESLNEVDKERYQTVYAQNPGSVAAPTAGLHFTDEMVSHLVDKGVLIDKITLHIGLGTFLPVKTEDIRHHQMHEEIFEITETTAQNLNARNPSRKQICVGTTTCRALESAASPEGCIQSGKYHTNIFIHPGYKFKYVKNLLTNFHQPGSSLIILVSTFASHELIQNAYQKAVKDRYRFLSYGDAMLIL
ncbi:MAG: tRNA preQ1(34) S-adenosylmethionine ribosyltransferase-isomerase QueA [Chlamydiales bacterium 38-26]|nr:tRNA preQ1(34) S-adenosylmethionine ribosyltransferase-isomerase QueA [Chlamydiales bacterium]OJV08491.1 MAG: tRNA preQ1(34) S-adenosylmethionine ribosyltransferase-isomerase QueA [Chlamydiales bacterium 38-26]